MASDVDITIFQPGPPAQRSELDINNLLDQFKNNRVSDWTLQQAFMCLLLSAAAADGSVAPEEQYEIFALARRARTLKALDATKLAQVNSEVKQRLRDRPDGLKEACEALPSDMRPSVFAHCVDMVLADGVLMQLESDYLNKIAGYMKLDGELAKRIAEVILLKNRF